MENETDFFQPHVAGSSNVRRQLSVMAAVFLLPLVFCSNSLAGGALGMVNIKLSGTIVAFSCNIDVSDKDKSVELGSWATSQLQKNGDKSSPIPFGIKLTGCPAGNVSAGFSGEASDNDTSLLALSDDSTAKNVAIEILDEDHKRIPLGQAGSLAAVDNNGDALLSFYADYLITADSPTAGSANAIANFSIYYD